MSSKCRTPLPPLAVLVLGMVAEKPRHPYEMVQLARLRYLDRLANIRAGSLYHAVAKLEANDLIAVHDVVREGNRPERTVYAITDDGRAALRRSLAEMLVESPPEYPQLYLALAQAHDVPRAEVADALARRADTMRAEYDELQATAKRLDDDGVPEMFFLDGGCRRVVLRAQLDWLEDLIARLRDHSIAWLDDPGFEEAWQHRLNSAETAVPASDH